MGLRLQVNPNTIVVIPPKVEAEGQDAIDAFVLKHTGVDLKAGRAESDRIRAEKRAAEEKENKAEAAKRDKAAAEALESGFVITIPESVLPQPAGDAGEEG